MSYIENFGILYDNKMNICSEVHSPAFKIVYKGAKGSDYQPEWLVCENCHEKRYFGTPRDILSIESLN